MEDNFPKSSFLFLTFADKNKVNLVFKTNAQKHVT